MVSIGNYEVVSHLESPECSLRLLRLEGAKVVNLHVHRKTTQHYYVLQGSTEVVLGTATHKLKRYQSIRIPAGIPHAVRTKGKALVLSISVPPLDAEDQHPWPDLNPS